MSSPVCAINLAPGIAVHQGVQVITLFGPAVEIEEIETALDRLAGSSTLFTGDVMIRPSSWPGVAETPRLDRLEIWPADGFVVVGRQILVLNPPLSDSDDGE